MKNRFMLLILFLVNILTPLAFGGVQPTPPGQVLPASDFLEQTIQVLTVMGGLPGMAKISAIIMLVIASLKVSVLDKTVWSKLGAAQVYVAPVLGLLYGLITLSAGQPLTTPMVVAYLFSGGGAVFLHEIMDSVKQLPGLGVLYVAAISFAERLPGGSSSDGPPPAAKP